MSISHCHCNDEHHGRLHKLADHHGIAWRDALRGLITPFVRLHQLRNVRTQMLHDALRDLDCREPRDRDA